MTQGPPTRMRRATESSEGGAGVRHATAEGRGAPNEARRVNGSGHARARPSFPPPLLPDTASWRCLRPTDRATRRDPECPRTRPHTRWTLARAPRRRHGQRERSKRGRWRATRAGRQKNEGCHAPQGPGRRTGLVLRGRRASKPSALSHYIHCSDGSCGSARVCPHLGGPDRVGIATLLSATGRPRS